MKIIPIAGSRNNAEPIMDRLFASQTQRLSQRMDFRRDLHPSEQQLAQRLGLAYLQGRWTLDDPALTRALELNREAGLNFQPGFTQLGRDDAAFYFVQGRALMIATGSWDSTSFRQQAGFEIGVFRIPAPSPDDPRYGAQLFGPAAENDVGTGLSFGIPRAGANVERALDFLRFLASQPANSKFSHRSGWLPSVEGVEPPAPVAPFLPVQTGYVDGFHLGQFGADSRRLLRTEMGRLVSPGGSVDKFREAIRAPLAVAIRDDLERVRRDSVLNISRQDVILQSLLETRAAHDQTADQKTSQLIEAQNRNEADTAWQALQLRLSRNAP